MQGSEVSLVLCNVTSRHGHCFIVICVSAAVFFLAVWVGHGGVCNSPLEGSGLVLETAAVGRDDTQGTQQAEYRVCKVPGGLVGGVFEEGGRHGPYRCDIQP